MNFLPTSAFSELFIPFDKKTERDQKISLESRKRIFAYSMLDFFVSTLTYFDFFSSDMFDFASQAKLLAYELNDKELYPEHFLYLLVSPRKEDPLQLVQILNSYDLNLKNLQAKFQSLDSNFSFKKMSFLKNFKQKAQSTYYRIIEKVLNRDIKDYFFENFENIDKYIQSEQIPFSPSIWIVFEKTAENAIDRFKSGIITPEIFFLTLMENKKSKIGKIISSFVSEEIDWLVLRFKIIKRIYYHESLIKQKVKNCYFPFAYLYKRTIPEIAFDQFLEREDRRFEEIVITFRNYLISELISYDLEEYLTTELGCILRSIKKLGQHRSYSF